MRGDGGNCTRIARSSHWCPVHDTGIKSNSFLLSDHNFDEEPTPKLEIAYDIGVLPESNGKTVTVFD